MLKIAALLPLLGLAAAFGAEERPLTVWSFQKTGPGMSAPATKVTIPHTWNADDSTRKDYYRGPAVYSCDIGPGEAFAGKRVFLRCEAVSTVAEIVLNGKSLGEHKGGFTEFGFELTDELDAKGPNVLEVRASNAWRADVIPLHIDFSLAGGMYRPVSLVVCDHVCLSPVADGTRGVTMRYGKATKAAASVVVTAALDNDLTAPTPVTVRFALLDAAGTKVAEVARAAIAAPGDTRFSATLAVVSPHLWNGVKDPYLYTTEVTVETDGKTTDTRRISTGFRDIRIDPKEGLFLNGEHVRLNGVNRHQDWETVGWALTPEQQRTDAALIREMGANAVRGSHYPHAREFLDACDKLGLLVWAEIPFVDTVGSPAQDPGLEANAVSQLREMIRQQGGHPAIFCWSLFNELGMAESADFKPLVRTLNDVAHAEDPTRPTTGATFYADKALAAIPDLMAFNNYPGWYYDTPQDMEKYVKLYRKAVPGKAWAISEYGAGASVKHHDPDVAKRIKSGADWHPEEWQSRVHEANYATLDAHPELWGTFLWNMFDFASIGKNEGDRHGINDKGMITRDRRTRKDTFYFYQANWADTPVLHLLSKKAETLKNSVFTVRLYSNLNDIRVAVNGAPSEAPALYALHAYALKPVTLKPGKNTVVATAKTADGTVVTDTAEWTVETK